MKRFRKIICSIIGHNYYKVMSINNGLSKYGYHRCNRCGKEHHWQWDF
jgi:hypothetical protein